MDINRSHASNSPAQSPSASEESRSAAPAAQADIAAPVRERGGAFVSLSERRRAHPAEAEDAQDAPQRAGSSMDGARPRKRLRTEQRVRFAAPEGEGSSSAGRGAPSQPMARHHAMPKRETDDPEQRRVNDQIAHNQRMLLDRLHIERQPAAALLRQDAVLAAAGVRLTAPELRGLLNDVLHLGEEARAEIARLLPAAHGGAYLSGDEHALEHALGGDVPAVVLRRAGWLMRAGLSSRLFPEAVPSELLSRTIEQAEADLREHFEHAGPSSQAQAVLDLVGSVLFAPNVEQAYRFAQLALQPRYVRALPEGRRASILSLLANGLLSAHSFACMELLPSAESADAGARAHDMARIDAFGTAHRNGLAQIIPLLREAVRGAASMPSNAAHGVLSSMARMVGRGMPDVPTQRALLELYDELLGRIGEPERGPAHAELAAMISTLGEAGLQRRAFDLVTRHRPGTARADDGLRHLDGAGRASVLVTVLDQLNDLGDDMREDALALLAGQTAPGVIQQLSSDGRRRLLEAARELAVPPGDNMRLLAVVGRLLEHASIDEIEQTLQVLFGHADTALDDDGLEQAVHQMWDRFLPQLPADRSAHLLAHAVAVDSAYLSFALHRFVGVGTDRLPPMLAAMNDQRSQPLANELVEQGMEEPDALHATVQLIVGDRPPAERAAAAAAMAQVLYWAATTMPAAQRAQAIRNSAREAGRILADTPPQARAALLVAYLRPECAAMANSVALRFLIGAMTSGRAQQFHAWVDTVARSDRLSIATGVARVLPLMPERSLAAHAFTVLEALYPRSLESWRDHHALTQALTNTLARWPEAFHIERVRVGAMLEHGIRALPPGPEHEQALHHLAAAARRLPQGASSSSEAPLGTQAWALQLIQSELTRTDDAARARVLEALGNNGGG
jgi:hypothetical protein